MPKNKIKKGDPYQWQVEKTVEGIMSKLMNENIDHIISYKKNQKELTISEIFLSNVAASNHTNEFDQNGVELWENSPEEIRDLAIEMDDRLNGNWNETKEDILLQEKFWSIFEENTKRLDPKIILNSAMSKIPNHGKIKARFGTKFLRENKNWIR